MKTENPKCWFKYTEVMSPACRFHVPSPVVWRLVGQLRLCKFKLVLKEWRKKEGILINKWHLGPFSFNHTMKKQEAQAVFWKYKSIYYKILKTLFLSSSISLSQGSFPGNLHLVLVLRPTALLQRTLSDFLFKFNKDEFKMKVPVWLVHCMCTFISSCFIIIFMFCF